MTDDTEAIWVMSERNSDGSASYVVTVSAGPDAALSLHAEAAMRYVSAVHRAAIIAQHDSAVLQQLTKTLALEVAEAGWVVGELRKDRVPVQDASTEPLRFEPIVSASTLKPYVHVWVRGKKTAQWTPEDCFQHAGHVVSALAGADLDAAYYQYLVNVVGIDKPAASGAVKDLGSYHTGLRDDLKEP